jgi:hypothetical protein
MIEIKYPKLFIYDRGTDINIYIKNIRDIPYDIYGGKKYSRYENEKIISEYMGFLHLPYQTNVQSLWENLGYNVIYFIPSKKCIEKWILEEDWYYWEEKNKPTDMVILSIEYAEWYQPELEKLFFYFDSWDDLYQKCKNITLDDIIKKKMIIHSFVSQSNQKHLLLWNQLLKEEIK